MNSTPAPLLAVHDVRAGYGRGQVLHDIDFHIERREIVAILGPNGAGKTTLLRVLAGLLPSRSGTFSWEGERLRRESSAARVERGVVLVPEGRQIFASMTTRENLLMGAYVRGRDASIDEDLERMYELFPVLRSMDGRMGSAMSGGQQQMLAIARGLMAKPRLLMLDEPSLGLAPVVVDDLESILRSLPSKFGISVVLVEQDTSLALSVASRAYSVQAGRVALTGPSHVVGDALQTHNLFLGGATAAGEIADAASAEPDHLHLHPTSSPTST